MVFFRQEHLFSPEECTHLLAAVQASRAERTGVVKPGTSQRVYDQSVRKTFRLNVPEIIQAKVNYRLMSIKPALEAFFTLELLGCHAPQFLAYQTGDFFERHSDAYIDPDRLIRVRRLSSVLFLNAGSELQPAGYTGGELVLYPPGTLPKAAENQVSGCLSGSVPEHLNLAGEACQVKSGDLLVFRPEQVHEVLPVRSGMRYTVVSWYY